jgi:hypothetical protein
MCWITSELRFEMSSSTRTLLAVKPSDKETRVSLHSYDGVGLTRTPRLFRPASEHL